MNYLTGEFTDVFHEWKAVRGGILADEMGLGKTVMAISLMVDDNFKGINLVVVPVNVLRQWISEFKTHCKQKVEVYEFHSNKNRKTIDLNKFDVVITTYGVLGNEYKAWANQD